MKIPGIEKITNIILLTLLLTASVAQNGKLLGIKNDKWFKPDSPEATVEAPSTDQLGQMINGLNPIARKQQSKPPLRINWATPGFKMPPRNNCRRVSGESRLPARPPEK